MIFKPDLAAAILRGEKTVTRRPISPNPRSPWCRSPLRYRLGFEFLIQPGQGKPSIASAQVTYRGVEILSTLLPADARREGFATRDAFVAAWTALCGSWDPDELVHVIGFKLTMPRCKHCAGTGRLPPTGIVGSDWSTCPGCFGSGLELNATGRLLLADTPYPSDPADRLTPCPGGTRTR